ncbi:MAG: DoxX family protein [Candidatus Magasanikbacteria bacterium]|nr:DoxX family protein [Candidatus Magasanikbacteria bacterium]
MMDFFASMYANGDWGLLALRLALAAIFIMHGKGKFKMWKMQPSAQMSSGMVSLMKFLSIAELFGGIAMLFGFLTQLAAIGLGIIMLGAMKFKIWVWKTPFASTEKIGWEFDLLILAVCVALFIFGPGTMSLDNMWFGL